MEHNNKNSSVSIFWILALASGLIFIGLGLRDPWPADEPRFAQIAREMVESGQWFFPVRGGELYSDKPPVFMWSIAAFYQLTHNLRLSFLLPSALCSILTLYLTYDLGRRFWSEKIGTHAALILLFTLQFILQAKTAQIDAMVACWITLACYGLLRHLVLGPSWSWYLFAWFVMGIGVITKGVGFLPILMLIPYGVSAYLQANEFPGKINWRWFAGVPMLLLAVGLWLIPMIYQVSLHTDSAFSAYRDDILFRQTAERYTDSWSHLKPFWFYLVSVIPLFWLPISLLLPGLITPWWWAIKQLERRIMLPLVWVLLVLLFFSLSPGKRGVYILPALPMLALVVAPYAGKVIQTNWFNRLIKTVLLLFSLMFIGIGVAGYLEMEKTIELVQKYQFSPWNFSVALGLVGLVSAILFRTKRSYNGWMVFVCGFWVLYSTWGYLLVNPARTPTIVFQNIEKAIGHDAEIGMINFREQFLLHTTYPITHFGYNTPVADQTSEAWRWLGDSSSRYVLVADEQDLSCFNTSMSISVGSAHSRNWLLLNSSSRMSFCKSPSSIVSTYRYEPKKYLRSK